MQMKPTAYSQIGDQVVRVLLIVLIAYLFSKQTIGLYKIGEFAVLASMIGAGIALLILVVFFIKSKPINHFQYKIPWGHYFQTIFTLGIVASLNLMVLLFIQFADVFMFVSCFFYYFLSIIYVMYEYGVFLCVYHL